MKTQALPHVPEAIMLVLEEVAFKLGANLDFVIDAAIWVFCQQELEVRELVVSEFWLRALPELAARVGESRPRTLKEKLHALAAYIYSVCCRCHAH